MHSHLDAQTKDAGSAALHSFNQKQVEGLGVVKYVWSRMGEQYKAFIQLPYKSSHPYIFIGPRPSHKKAETHPKPANLSGANEPSGQATRYVHTRRKGSKKNAEPFHSLGRLGFNQNPQPIPLP